MKTKSLSAFLSLLASVMLPPVHGQQAYILTPNLTPRYVYAKSVTVLTTGVPADIATISIPPDITRWHTSVSNLGTSIAETASGSMSAATFQMWDGAGGTGIQIAASFAGPSSTTGSNSRIAIVSPSPVSTQSWSTSSTLYIRQTVNSGNAGTVSFYVTIFPLP